MKIKKRKVSFIELVLYIIIIPLTLSIMSSIMIFGNNLSSKVTYNNKTNNSVSYFLKYINNDINSSYNVDIKENQIDVYTNRECVSYKKIDNFLYRNEDKLFELENITLLNTTNTNNEFNLYELELSYYNKDLKNKKYPINIKVYLSSNFKN